MPPKSKAEQMADKDKISLETVLAQIQKEFGEGAIMRLGDEEVEDGHRLPSPPGPSPWTWPSASAASRAAGSSRSSVRNPPARRP